jgi:hypothetical protein
MDQAALNALFRSVEGPNEQLFTIGNYTLLALAISMIVTWAWPTAVAIFREWQRSREDRKLEAAARRWRKATLDACARRARKQHLERMAAERDAIAASWEAARSPAWLV